MWVWTIYGYRWYPAYGPAAYFPAIPAPVAYPYYW
jgi:hypothetical protein